MDERELTDQEKSWERIDEVVQLFMDGASIADARAFTVDKYGAGPQTRGYVFCTDISCSRCILDSDGRKPDETYRPRLCSILFPCSPDEWVEYV